MTASPAPVSNFPPPLVAVVGTTAVGKSDVAVAIAREFGGEIVNFDSRQLYRGLDVGTAKPSPEARGGIPHHGFDLLDPREAMSAGAFLAFARGAVESIRARGRLPVLVGGTGFYLRALRDGLSPLPATDPRLRARLRKMLPGESAHRWLRAVDSPRSAEVAPRDRDRSIRAVEIALLAGRRMSELVKAPRSGALVGSWLVVGCRRGREPLYSRISARVDDMFANGLIDEVRRCLAEGIPPEAPGLSAIGYREAAALCDGRLTSERAKEATVIATRQYAKRQATWFRGEPGVEWFELDSAGAERAILARVASFPGIAPVFPEATR